MARRPRDNQRSRVYKWEGRVNPSLYRADFDTLAQCQDYAEPIWRKERGRVGRAKVKAPPIDRPSWGQRRALAHHDHRITLPRWARSRWVILHEMAHRLTPRDEAHGPRFVGVLMGLACRWLDYDADHLMRAADECGVAYYVRSIGVVPVHNHAWHVMRVLRTHEPMTAMDLACWLSLGDDVSVTVKQVRAVAAGLIKQGKARWLRHKLVLVNNHGKEPL